MGKVFLEPKAVVTSAAEKCAESLGLRGSLLLAQQIVRQTFPSLKAIYVDTMNDPEEGGYPTICFVVTVSETVRKTLEFDEALQDALYNRIPAGHRMYLSFRYKFKSICPAVRKGRKIASEVWE